MASVNKVIILGNVGQDPEIREGNFIVAALSIATVSYTHLTLPTN